MAWPVSDLSSITDLLVTNLTAAIQTSPIHVAAPFHFEVSGLMPAVTRVDTVDQLSLYLLHVSRDPYWRNTPISGQRGLLNEAQPLSLNLSYLLTSYAEKSWRREQQLMSIALEYFHSNPIYKTGELEFTITVEADSIEEMSRLWQAITVPIRLSAMFRVAVVFLTPPKTPPIPKRPPMVAALSVSPTLDAPVATEFVPLPAPQLFQVEMQTTYTVPPVPNAAVITLIPAAQPVLVGGDTVTVLGSGLDLPNASTVYLTSVTTSEEWPVNWQRLLTLPVAPSTVATISPYELGLVLPAAYGAVPGAGSLLTTTPMPGQYRIAVGPAAGGLRSAALPVAIAPGVDGVANPAQLMAAADGTFTFQVRGYVAGLTSVLLDGLALTAGGAAAAGVFAYDTVHSAILFQLPATPAGLNGSFSRLRLIVNGVEAPPGWWIQWP